MKNLIWWIGLLLLLSGCGATLNEYHGYVDYPKKAQIDVYNDANYDIWVALEINNITISPKDFFELNKRDVNDAQSTKHSFHFVHRDKVTLVIRYFDQNGLEMIKRDEHITRQARHSRIEEVHVTDATLLGYTTEDCVVVNFTGQNLIVDSDCGHHFTLPAHTDTTLTGFLSGKPANFSWQSVNHPRQWPYTYQYTPTICQQVWYNGRWYGFKIRLNSF